MRGAYDLYASQYTQAMCLLGQGTLPAFIVIGTQKGGTTSLYGQLVEHPQVLGAITKEPQFFTFNYQKGICWYRACFPIQLQMTLLSKVIGRRVITGEATPYYLAHPSAAQRIAKTLPNVKLIVLLRNPVDRLISHYHHMVRLGRETLSLREALACEEDRLRGDLEKLQTTESYASLAHATYSYLTRGKYVDQLESFAEYFPRGQMLILKSEDFFVNAQASYNEVLTFLDLDPHALRSVKVINKGDYAKQDHRELRQELQDIYRPYNERLYEFLGRDLGWERVP